MNNFDRITRVILFILGIQTGFARAGEINPGELTAQCDRLLSRQFPADGPGATALIARRGQIVYKNAFGMANLELQVPMQLNNVFRIGSITKQFTAIAVLQLAERGKLGLQDEITKYIPDYPTQGSRITTENLLTNTSGIQDYAKLQDSSWKGEVDATPAQMIDFFKNRPMRFAPGTRWEYSNSNFVLLGYIIEKITGESYAAYLDKQIFQPTGMTDSRFATDIGITKNRADGYSMGEQGIENARYLSMTKPYAAGAIQSTVEDLFKWHQALYSYKLISKASLEKALTPYILTSGEKTKYGYGLRFGFIQNSPSIWHGGMINGFVAMEMYLPKEDVFVAVFSNCDCNSPEDVTAKLAAWSIGEPYEYTAVTLPDSILSEFQGVYENDKGQMRVITLADHQLFAQSNRGPHSKIDALALDRFVYQSDTLVRIDFVRAKSGVVEQLVTKGRTAIITWNKTDKPIPSPDGIELSEKTLDKYVGQYAVTPEFGFTVAKVGARLKVQGTGQDPLDMFAETETKFFVKVNDAQFEFVKDNAGAVTKVILSQGGRTAEAKKVK